MYTWGLSGLRTNTGTAQGNEGDQARPALPGGTREGFLERQCQTLPWLHLCSSIHLT